MVPPNRLITFGSVANLIMLFGNLAHMLYAQQCILVVLFCHVPCTFYLSWNGVMVSVPTECRITRPLPLQVGHVCLRPASSKA